MLRKASVSVCFHLEREAEALLIVAPSPGRRMRGQLEKTGGGRQKGRAKIRLGNGRRASRPGYQGPLGNSPANI